MTNPWRTKIVALTDACLLLVEEENVLMLELCFSFSVTTEYMKPLLPQERILLKRRLLGLIQHFQCQHVEKKHATFGSLPIEVHSHFTSKLPIPINDSTHYGLNSSVRSLQSLDIKSCPNSKRKPMRTQCSTEN